LEKDYESAGLSKENLSQLQNRTAQRCAVRDLHRQETQAAPGLNRGWDRLTPAGKSGLTLSPAVWFRYNVLFTLAARS
jgi:hypothetical protein